MGRLWLLVAPCLCLQSALAWNSAATQSHIYTFQEFYSDAQYGPDFGYYSTGKILHADGPADNGESGDSQEWFNSYTTLPMSLSPDFAHALCDRLVTMWHSMGRPRPFVLTEFGGGTGMLARDILRRARDAHAEFYEAVVRYMIAERSQAMRATQSKTGREFVAAGKLVVVRVDGRQIGASPARQALEEAIGPGQPVVGIILSNELLDEFDPARLRLMWRKGHLPNERRVQECQAYREAHVVHSVDTTALEALVRNSGGLLNGASVEELQWEGQSVFCGLAQTPALRRVMLSIAEDLTPAERWQCAPSVVCCYPFVLTISQALQYNHEALYDSTVTFRLEDGSREIVGLYRKHFQNTNNTVPLSKERYRQLRRLAAAQGGEVERALLIGQPPAILPGRIRSAEVMLALSASRCEELRGFFGRHAKRLVAAARLRDASAPIFDGYLIGRTASHLKLILRPGEATFVQQAAGLIDEGFMVTMDYGADADALLWHALIRPNYEGIHIMDARDETLAECTSVSYLECPGLQDLTTSVDFTEVAVAGKQLGNWEVKAYGPIFLLELSFDLTELGLAPKGNPYSLGHLVERAGGLRTTGLQAWYRKPEMDPWASFKVLVQHRGSRGADWSLGPLSHEWPLAGAPRMFRAPSACWRRDMTKPPLASLITTATHRWLDKAAWVVYSEEAASASSPMVASWAIGAATSQAPEEGDHVLQALSEQFVAVLLHNNQPLGNLYDDQGVAQQHLYADTHLSLILVDYWRMVEETSAGKSLEEKLAETRGLASTRRLPELYSETTFERVFRDLSAAVFGFNSSGALHSEGSDTEGYPAYVCLAAKALHGECLGGLC